MLDFARAVTPPRDGDTLVLPPPAEMVRALRGNAAAIDAIGTPLLDSTLAAVRRATRTRISGSPDRPVIVTGHQPAFAHAGVWAKHIVASRLAAATDGLAVNLVVDSDAPASTSLDVPSIHQGRVKIVRVPFGAPPAGRAFEELPVLSAAKIDEIRRAVADALGVSRYATSQMDVFLSAMSQRPNEVAPVRAATVRERFARDWVEQIVAGRRTVEARFGVSVHDVRVSEAFDGPLVADLLLRAGQFRAAYNTALAVYRAEHRVRSAQRPIPDLALDDRSCETPLWAYRPGQPRGRLAVERSGDRVILRTETETVGELSANALGSVATASAALATLAPWRIRPRALTLTLWARLLLADLFIHGIGGAKYDRITDRIMADFYGVPPPEMGCVSATLRLPLPRGSMTGREAGSTLRAMKHELHDVRCNPDRHVPPAEALQKTIAARHEAVRAVTRLRADRPGDHAARRTAHLRIREAGDALHRLCPEALAAARRRLEEVRGELANARIADSREFFFGLFSDEALRRLCVALPAVEEFRV